MFIYIYMLMPKYQNLSLYIYCAHLHFVRFYEKPKAIYLHQYKIKETHFS